MTYNEACKIIGAKQYSKCNAYEKKQMDIAMKFINNPANMPKNTFNRTLYEFQKAFKQEIVKPLERMFYTIFKYINEII